MIWVCKRSWLQINGSGSVENLNSCFIRIIFQKKMVRELFVEKTNNKNHEKSDQTCHSDFCFLAVVFASEWFAKFLAQAIEFLNGFLVSFAKIEALERLLEVVNASLAVDLGLKELPLVCILFQSFQVSRAGSDCSTIGLSFVVLQAETELNGEEVGIA